MKKLLIIASVACVLLASISAHSAVNATVNESQLVSKINDVLNSWSYGDGDPFYVGGGSEAKLGEYNGTYLEGPNPGSLTNMWVDCPAMAYSDPSVASFFVDDFFRYNSGDWTITTVEAGAGSASEAISSTADKSQNGVLLLTNDDADNDRDELQQLGEAWDLESLTAGKKIWFEVRVQLDEATQNDVAIGLYVTDTNVLAGSVNGVYFRKDDGDANWDFCSYGSAESEVAGITTAVADTWVILGFYYDGAGTLSPYVDGVAGSTITTGANIPSTDQLTFTLAVQNGEASAHLLYIDYVKIVQMR